MKRTLYAVCMLLAACFTACWQITAEAAHQVVAVYRYAREAIRDFCLSAVKTAATAFRLWASPVPLTQARAYVMRLAKRERPELTGSWRMCHST